MNTEMIDQLVERYLDGETSHEEEANLAALIESEGVQSEYLHILKMLKSAPVTPILTEKDNEILTTATRKAALHLLYWFGSAVASMLLLIGIGSFFHWTTKPESAQEFSSVSATESPYYHDEHFKEETNLVALHQKVKTSHPTTLKIRSTGDMEEENVSSTFTKEDANIAEQKVVEEPIESEIPITDDITVKTHTQSSITKEYKIMSASKVYHRLFALSVSGGALGQTVGSMAPPVSPSTRSAATQREEILVTYGKHYMPWTVGINARYDISKHWAIETGLTYTGLKTELLTWADKETITQRLHYVGIPLKVDYKILSWNNLICYANAGGLVEKCVYATIGGESFSIPELQYSASVSAGVEYNIDKHLSLYFEPGIGYYFDNNDNVKSIRKASPLTVNITGGLRININPTKK